MPDDPGPQHPNLDHLVAAGHELVAAARGFLDSVEGVLADPEKVASAMGSVSSLLEDAGSAFSRLVEHGADHEGPEEHPADADSRPSRRLRPIDVDFSDG